MASGFYAFACFFFLKSLLTTYAQSTPSVHPVPPLQWLNITGLIQGTPAAVKYPSIGYDSATSTLIVFGGESSSGIATDQTFLYVYYSLPIPSEFMSSVLAWTSLDLPGVLLSPRLVYHKVHHQPDTWLSVVKTSPRAS